MSIMRDRTSMGGTDGMFHTTCWTQIIDSKTTNEARESLIINDLLNKYWKPVYCYLRRKGYDNESAKDLTQGFFHEVVLGRKLIQRADKTKGKFRTFLLTALDRYTVDVYDKETAGKRRPTGKIFQIDDFDIPDISEDILDLDPEQGFHYAWVSDLLDQVLSEVEQECLNSNKEVHWKVFCARLLDPIVNSSKPLSLSEICEKYNIENESRASNMIITVKRRLRKALERYLHRFAKSDPEIEQEIYELLKIFSRAAQGE